MVGALIVIRIGRGDSDVNKYMLFEPINTLPGSQPANNIAG